MFSLIVFAFYNCETDNEEVKEPIIESSNTQITPTVKTVSYDEVGEKFNNLKNEFKLQQHLDDKLQSDLLSRTTTDTLGLTIYTDVIKEITLGNYTSYTMRIATANVDSTKFYNLTIEDKNGTAGMFITKYTPTPYWLDNKNEAYEGEIATQRTNDLTTVGEDDSGISEGGLEGIDGGSSSTYPEDCDGFVIGTTVLVAYPCGCSPKHWPLDIVNPDDCRCGDQPGHEYVTTYECIESYSGDNDIESDNNGSYSGSGNVSDDSNTNNSGPSSFAIVIDPDGESIVTTSGDVNGDGILDAYELLAVDLSLSIRQLNWLYANPSSFNQIILFLESNGDSDEARAYSVLAIDSIIENDFTDLFLLDIFSQDPYNVWKNELNDQEKEIIKVHPFKAYKIFKNRTIAEIETSIRFGTNGLNDKSDAFRHAFFQSINSRDVGISVAGDLADAHESEVPSRWILEKQMDLLNNEYGLIIGDSNTTLDNQTLSDLIYQAIIDGNLVYLYPIDYTGYTILGSPFWDNPTTPEPNDGTHGITILTALTPTN